MALQLIARLFASQPKLPTFDELPPFHDMPGCGWIWGEDDQLGTVNLLSDEVVRRACREEVRYASSIRWLRTQPLPSILNPLALAGSGNLSPSIGPPSGFLLPGTLLMIGLDGAQAHQFPRKGASVHRRPWRRLHRSRLTSSLYSVPAAFPQGCTQARVPPTRRVRKLSVARRHAVFGTFSHIQLRSSTLIRVQSSDG